MCKFDNCLSEAEYVMAVHGCRPASVVPAQTFQCGSCGKNNLVLAAHPAPVPHYQPAPVCVTPPVTILPPREITRNELTDAYYKGYRQGLDHHPPVAGPTLASAIIIALSLCTATIIICGMIAANTP